MEIYTNEKLYNTNSWLQKPIKTVEEIEPQFEVNLATHKVRKYLEDTFTG